MHKFTVLAVMLVALVAVSTGRRSRLFQMRSTPFRTVNQPRRFSSYPTYGGNYMGYNMPYNMPMGPFGARMPMDGDYYGPMGTTTIDGSDVSFDSHGDYMPMGPMMG